MALEPYRSSMGVFVHTSALQVSALEESGIRSLNEGDKVIFEFEEDL